MKLGVWNEELGGYGKHKLSLIIRKRLKGRKLMVHLWKFALSKFSPLSLSKRRRKLGVRNEELGGFGEYK